MNLKECYIQMGGAYDEVLGRLRSEERVAKFLRMFLQDESFASLCASLDSGDDETAFRMAHTLKGVCQNLSLTRLYESSMALTEALRGGVRTGDVDGLLAQVQADYFQTAEAIRALE